MVIVILNFIYSLILWSLLNGFLSLIFNENFYILILKVKLLPQGEIYIDRKILRKERASSPTKKGLLHQVFTLQELANWIWTGVGKPHSVLDQEKLDLLRGKTIQVIAFNRHHTSDHAVHTAKWDHASWFIFKLFFFYTKRNFL